jgi:hypothetical protein
MIIALFIHDLKVLQIKQSRNTSRWYEGINTKLTIVLYTIELRFLRKLKFSVVTQRTMRFHSNHSVISKFSDITCSLNSTLKPQRSGLSEVGHFSRYTK